MTLTPSELAAELRRLKQRCEDLNLRDGFKISVEWENAWSDLRMSLSDNLPTILAALDRAAGPGGDTERLQAEHCALVELCALHSRELPEPVRQLLRDQAEGAAARIRAGLAARAAQKGAGR